MTDNSNTLRIALWNVQWAARDSARAEPILDGLETLEPDIICLTETGADLLDDFAGFTIASAEDFGYAITVPRRKILLWSHHPWAEVDISGGGIKPGGHFVAGRTETAIGELLVVGVVIPWFGSHVNEGNRSRSRWDDHLAYLEGLSEYLHTQPAERVIVLGDFNQRIPHTSQPKYAWDTLLQAFDGFYFPTGGEVEGIGEYTYQHLAHTPDFLAESVEGWSPVVGDLTLSEYPALLIELSLTDS